MYRDTSDTTAGRLNLSRLAGGMDEELRCLLGPTIRVATGRLPARGSTAVRAPREEIVALLRHLALDAHDAMPTGGTVTIRTGRLGDAAECAAIVIHEVPDSPVSAARGKVAPPRKGRSLGLGACFVAVERAGGHFHVSCRDGETVVTICFPLAR